MDWGLVDKNAGENRFLREEIVYAYKVIKIILILNPHPAKLFAVVFRHLKLELLTQIPWNIYHDVLYSESTHEIQLQWFIVHTLNVGLSVKNAFYTRKPLGILYKSQWFWRI